MKNTMDTSKLNEDLMALVLKKNELSRLDYNDPTYDTIEEELHDMEDQFLENHGPHMEKALKEVHRIHCPDNEVLLPIAYLANHYTVVKNDGGEVDFTVDPDEGVLVDVDQHAGKLSRLVLVPNPVRILLSVQGDTQMEVWRDPDHQ